MLYVTFQRLRERVKARFGGSAKQSPSDVPPPSGTKGLETTDLKTAKAHVDSL
jgi:hypothetical protein